MPNVVASNFLIPNGTFIAELVGFVIIVFVLGKKLVPLVNKAMSERQEAIRRGFSDAEEAKARLEAAENEYREQIAGARADAARQKEEAREQGAQIPPSSKRRRSKSPTALSRRHSSRSKPSAPEPSPRYVLRSAPWRSN